MQQRPPSSLLHGVATESPGPAGALSFATRALPSEAHVKLSPSVICFTTKPSPFGIGCSSGNIVLAYVAAHWSLGGWTGALFFGLGQCRKDGVHQALTCVKQTL